MPIPALVAAGALSAVGAGINAWNTGRMNKKSMQFSREMYQQQKTDNLDFWAMQNEYNSPEAQMQRFKDAGLNPNLIYGQGNAGNAGPVSTADVQRPQFENSRPGDVLTSPLSALDLVTNLEMKTAQIDNVRAQNDVINKQAALLGSQIENTQAGTHRKLFDLNLETELYQTSVDARKEALRQMQINNDLAIRRDLREAVQQSSSLKEAAERISKMVEEQKLIRLQQTKSYAERSQIIADTARIRKQIDLMSKEGVIKDLDVNLSKMSIRPGDPIWYRALAAGFSSLIDYFNQ